MMRIKMSTSGTSLSGNDMLSVSLLFVCLSVSNGQPFPRRQGYNQLRQNLRWPPHFTGSSRQNMRGMTGYPVARPQRNIFQNQGMPRQRTNYISHLQNQYQRNNPSMQIYSNNQHVPARDGKTPRDISVTIPTDRVSVNNKILQDQVRDRKIQDVRERVFVNTTSQLAHSIGPTLVRRQNDVWNVVLTSGQRRLNNIPVRIKTHERHNQQFQNQQQRHLRRKHQQLSYTNNRQRNGLWQNPVDNGIRNNNQFQSINSVQSSIRHRNNGNLTNSAKPRRVSQPKTHMLNNNIHNTRNNMIREYNAFRQNYNEPHNKFQQKQQQINSAVSKQDKHGLDTIVPFPSHKYDPAHIVNNDQTKTVTIQNMLNKSFDILLLDINDTTRGIGTSLHNDELSNHVSIKAPDLVPNPDYTVEPFSITSESIPVETHAVLQTSNPALNVRKETHNKIEYSDIKTPNILGLDFPYLPSEADKDSNKANDDHKVSQTRVMTTGPTSIGMFSSLQLGSEANIKHSSSLDVTKPTTSNSYHISNFPLKVKPDMSEFKLNVPEARSTFQGSVFTTGFESNPKHPNEQKLVLSNNRTLKKTDGSDHTDKAVQGINQFTSNTIMKSDILGKLSVKSPGVLSKIYTIPNYPISRFTDRSKPAEYIQNAIQVKHKDLVSPSGWFGVGRFGYRKEEYEPPKLLVNANGMTQSIHTVNKVDKVHPLYDMNMIVEIPEKASMVSSSRVSDIYNFNHTLDKHGMQSEQSKWHSSEYNHKPSLNDKFDSAISENLYSQKDFMLNSKIHQTNTFQSKGLIPLLFTEPIHLQGLLTDHQSLNVEPTKEEIDQHIIRKTDSNISDGITNTHTHKNQENIGLTKGDSTKGENKPHRSSTNPSLSFYTPSRMEFVNKFANEKHGNTSAAVQNTDTPLSDTNALVDDLLNGLMFLLSPGLVTATNPPTTTTIKPVPCDHTSPTFKCKGKGMFTSLDTLITWCLNQCKSDTGCVETVCECNCEKPKPAVKHKNLKHNLKKKKVPQSKKNRAYVSKKKSLSNKMKKPLVKKTKLRKATGHRKTQQRKDRPRKPLGKQGRHGTKRTQQRKWNEKRRPFIKRQKQWQKPKPTTEEPPEIEWEDIVTTTTAMPLTTEYRYHELGPTISPFVDFKLHNIKEQDIKAKHKHVKTIPHVHWASETRSRLAKLARNTAKLKAKANKWFEPPVTPTYEQYPSIWEYTTTFQPPIQYDWSTTRPVERWRKQRWRDRPSTRGWRRGPADKDHGSNEPPRGVLRERLPPPTTPPGSWHRSRQRYDTGHSVEYNRLNRQWDGPYHVHRNSWGNQEPTEAPDK